MQLKGPNGTIPDLSEWIPVELEIVDRIWKPDTEILKLKGFHSLEVLGRLQVSNLKFIVYCQPLLQLFLTFYSDIQLRKMNVIPLVNKPYVNEVTLSPLN